MSGKKILKVCYTFQRMQEVMHRDFQTLTEMGFDVKMARNSKMIVGEGNTILYETLEGVGMGYIRGLSVDEVVYADEVSEYTKISVEKNLPTLSRKEEKEVREDTYKVWVEVREGQTYTSKGVKQVDFTTHDDFVRMPLQDGGQVFLSKSQILVLTTELEVE